MRTIESKCTEHISSIHLFLFDLKEVLPRVEAVIRILGGKERFNWCCLSFYRLIAHNESLGTCSFFFFADIWSNISVERQKLLTGKREI